MKYLLACIILFTVTINFSYADTVYQITDDFDGPYLDSTYWSETFHDYSLNLQTNAYDGTMAGEYIADHASTFVGAGELHLYSNFVLKDDFDATLTLKQNRSGNSLLFTIFGFYKDGVNIDWADSGITWGFVGESYGVIFDETHTTPLDWHSYNGNDFELPNDVWYQFRIKRTNDDINTYHRQVGSETWILQNTYDNFGTEDLYLAFDSGSGSTTGNTLSVNIDQFTVQGEVYGDLIVKPIPEPLSIVLISLSCGFLLKRKQR